MFEILKKLSSLDEITEFGITLLGTENLRMLESEIRQKQLSFSQDDYWAEDKLGRYTAGPDSLVEAFAIISKESESTATLHRLQLIQQCCPAVWQPITRLLSRTTY